MTEKRRLGRGLGALINEALTGDADIIEISLSQIVANPLQPRINFDKAKLQELANSIKEHGVVQPVVITPAQGEGYYLVAGERRCRAAKMAGLTRIPALVRELDEKDMLEIALIENLQREDLNPIEEAVAYRRLMQEFEMTQEELSRRLGKSRPAIANMVRLLALPQGIQKAIISGELSAGQARPLLSLPDAARQEELAAQIISRKLTVREVERLAGEAVKVVDKKPEINRVKAEDPILKELQEGLQRHFGTKVKINCRKAGGTIEISYYGEDDLERLIDLMMPRGIE